MVGIVAVSHSPKLAEGVKEIALQMAREVPFAAAGGTKDQELGTDMERIVSAIHEVYSEDGVLVLFDLGSSYMNAAMAVEMLTEEMQQKVRIIDAALVEGAIVAAVESSVGKNLGEVAMSIKDLCLYKMPEP